jgi:hypothetical protein
MKQMEQKCPHKSEFKTGDVDVYLVTLINQIVCLGNLYEMWEDRKLTRLAQKMSRALEGKAKDNWLEIIADHYWNNESN